MHLRKGLAAGVESVESSFEETVKPPPDQPPKRFEHYELVRGEDGKPVELGAQDSSANRSSLRELVMSKSRKPVDRVAKRISADLM